MARLPIRMPKMSMTMTEGEVSTWLAEVGDEVAAGDAVCEVMTDKVDMEVESTAAGRLVEIVVREGMVDVGETIGWLEGEEDGLGDLFADDPEPAAEQPEADAVPEPGTGTGTAAGLGGTQADTAVPDDAVAEPVDALTPDEPPQPAAPTRPPAAVPRARALAREHGIDLASVTGTGPDGLVRVPDVESHADRASASTSAPAASPQAASPLAASPLAASPQAASPQAGAPRAPARSGSPRAAMIRAAVARKMVESASVPQFTVWRDLRLDHADRDRKGVSWTTVLLRAYTAALREVPELTCRWDAETSSPVEVETLSVALAVATGDGLLAPVFVEPDRREAADLDRELKQVVTAAATGRLDPSYLGTASASLSNLGGLGVDRFQALVTPPQASVLALGSVRPRPVAVQGGVGLALTLTAGLSVDHRVGDGAHGARLLDALARELGSDA